MATEQDLVALARRVQEACLGLGLTLATAESCTGGLVAHILTEVPGSSEYFAGGVVAYSDAVKQQALGVGPELLAAHGAVSAQVARAMAMGVRARLGVDLGLAVTGIAGPGGGTESKPVGLTYLAVAHSDGVVVRRVVWAGERSENKRASAEAVLEMVLAVPQTPSAAGRGADASASGAGGGR